MYAIRPSVLRVLALLLALSVLLSACNQGMPELSGAYELKPQSLTWDGQQYRFAWVDGSGGIHWATGDDVQLVQDTRSYLEIRDGHPVVHLVADEPIAVLGRDRDGDFSSPWFPFLAGAALGNALGGRTAVINQPYPGTGQVPPDRPAYRYPPSDAFGRGDSLTGSITNSRAAAPNYRVAKPIPDAVSGQSGGAGGGSAASGKSPSYSSGQAGGAGSGTAASSKGSGLESGQAGGTGSGSAASSKGTFRSSDSAPSSSPKLSPGGKAPSVGGSSGGGFRGGKSSGGFSGGRSGGGRK